MEQGPREYEVGWPLAVWTIHIRFSPARRSASTFVRGPVPTGSPLSGQFGFGCFPSRFPILPFFPLIWVFSPVWASRSFQTTSLPPRTHSFFGRPFWACVTTIAFCSFIIQTYFTLSDYLEYRTIIEMQLKFEPGSTFSLPLPYLSLKFPFQLPFRPPQCTNSIAISIFHHLSSLYIIRPSIPFRCNLNAFKLSEVRKFEEIEQGIQLWEKAISTLDRLKESPVRRRRQVTYRPVYVR